MEQDRTMFGHILCWPFQVGCAATMHCLETMKSPSEQSAPDVYITIGHVHIIAAYLHASEFLSTDVIFS